MENYEMLSSVMGGEEAQMPPESSLSYGALVQQTAAVLKNECANLESRIKNKEKEVEEVKKLCAIQAENIAKQQSELEHLKVKTLDEEMKNNSHLAKIHSLRENLEVVNKHFEKLGKTIYSAVSHKKDLEGKIIQLKERQEIKEAAQERLEVENKHYLEAADQAYVGLLEHKEREKTELCELKTHLSNQLEEKKLKGRQLEQELRELQSVCREKAIMVEILTPQAAELKITLDKLKTELATEQEQMNFTIKQIETSLQEELKKRNELSGKIETENQNINKLNTGLREKETEIKILDNRLKQLHSEEEEYAKTSKTQEQEVQRLESTMEELTSRLSTLMKVKEENVILEDTCKDLENENNDYKKKIMEAEHKEGAFNKQLEELSRSIEGLEIEKEKVIDERLVIEDKIKELQKKQDDDKNKNKGLRMNIDKTLAELQNENDVLTTSLQDLKKHILEESETKSEIEKTMKNLETELARAKAVSQESDFKLNSHCEECNALSKVYKEEIQILNETMQRNIEEYEKTLSDCKLSENVKEEVKQLTEDLGKKRDEYVQHLQQLQECFLRELEDKSKAMSELRAQCEREFRNKEAMKTDALVELKEIKARIIEIGKQKVSIEKELITKADILKKCDNLIQRLTTKFNKVAQVATTLSQSVSDAASQRANFATPRTQRKPVRVKSPGSDSSGKTFNPDDVDNMKKMSRKRQPLRPLSTLPTQNTQNLPKKKPAYGPPKKTVPDTNDDWGFTV